jgi:hypothetical protein
LSFAARDSPEETALPPDVEEVLALQRTVGNAQVTRLLREPRLQRMPFARFQGVSRIFNWRYIPLERGLQAKEKEVGAYVASLEDWVKAAPTVKALVGEFEGIKTTPLAASDYQPTMWRLSKLLIALREARAAVLNEQGRVRGEGGPFSNRLAAGMIGEVNEFLAPGEKLRITVPVDPAESVDKAAEQAPDDLRWAGGVAATITGEQKRLRAALEDGGSVVWVYTANGLLTIGTNTKHSVLAAGADVRAAGQARLSLPPDEGRDSYFGAHQARQRARELEEQIAKIGEGKQKSDLQANLEHSRKEAERLEEKATRLGFDPSKPRDKGQATILVDFNSGHYHPSQAWKATHQAWESLGYKVEWDPQSTFT